MWYGIIYIFASYLNGLEGGGWGRSSDKVYHIPRATSNNNFYFVDIFINFCFDLHLVFVSFYWNFKVLFLVETISYKCHALSHLYYYLSLKELFSDYIMTFLKFFLLSFHWFRTLFVCITGSIFNDITDKVENHFYFIFRSLPFITL